MTRYRPGDIILVRFPFTDLSTSKKRPALVLSTPRFTAHQGDVVVLAMTSQPQSEGKLRLSRWQSAGMPRPSAANWSPPRPSWPTVKAAACESASVLLERIRAELEQPQKRPTTAA